MTLYCWDCYVSTQVGLTHCPRHGTDEERRANRAKVGEMLSSMRIQDSPLFQMIKKGDP